MLAEYRAQGKFPEEKPILESDGLKIYGDAATLGAADSSVGAVLAAFLNQARPGDYVAIMAYIQPTPEHTVALQSLRLQLRDSSHLATTLGYGPRFLHSTGQLHKGGANNGLFIQITADDTSDLPIPGEPYTFAVLNRRKRWGIYVRSSASSGAFSGCIWARMRTPNCPGSVNLCRMPPSPGRR